MNMYVLISLSFLMCYVMGSKFNCELQEFFILVRISEEYPDTFLSNASFSFTVNKDGPDPLTMSRLTIKLSIKIMKKLNCIHKTLLHG